MMHNNQNRNLTQQSGHSGLTLSGVVINRLKRMVPRNNPTIEVITYTVQDVHGTKFYVEDYQHDGYHEIGDTVNIPVYVKVYNRKNGEPSYTLNVQKDDSHSSRGEPF